VRRIFHKIEVKIFGTLEKLFKNYIFTMKSGLAKGFKRRYGFGFIPKLFLTMDEQFLLELDLSNKVVYDIGGYIGIYAMFFSRAVGERGEVFTFEPNLKNYHELLFNLQLNNISNVTTRNLGLGREYKKAQLRYNPIFPGRGTIREEIENDRSRISRSKTTEIQIDSLDNILQNELLPNPDFIKIDVEGFELEVLQGMLKTLSKDKPDIYIEIHGILPPEMVHLLHLHRYSIYHVESSKKTSESEVLWIRGGHIYCRHN